jgi:AraC family transcriptional regulator
MTTAPDMHRAGRAIEQWIGLPAVRSSGSERRKATVHMWRGEAGDCHFGALDEPMIVFHTGGASNVPVRRDRRWLDMPSQPGLLTVVPPETPVTWRVGGQVHSYTVHLASNCFEGLVEADRVRLLAHLELRCGTRDAVLAGLVSALASELETPTELGPLYVDAIADSMALHILRRASSITPDTGSGGLSARALHRAIERIDSRVENGISLQELADEVGLSRAHFAKAFRQSTGLSPHRYLTNRRIGVAQERLSSSDDPLAEIALACGFSSQAHFTEYFRRATGQTPRAFRRAR